MRSIAQLLETLLESVSRTSPVFFHAGRNEDFASIMKVGLRPRSRTGVKANLLLTRKRKSDPGVIYLDFKGDRAWQAYEPDLNIVPPDSVMYRVKVPDPSRLGVDEVESGKVSHWWRSPYGIAAYPGRIPPKFITPVFREVRSHGEATYDQGSSTLQTWRGRWVDVARVWFEDGEYARFALWGSGKWQPAKSSEWARVRDSIVNSELA